MILTKAQKLGLQKTIQQVADKIAMATKKFISEGHAWVLFDPRAGKVTYFDHEPRSDEQVKDTMDALQTMKDMNER